MFLLSKDWFSPEITLLSAGLVGSSFQGIGDTVVFSFFSFLSVDQVFFFLFSLSVSVTSGYGRSIKTMDQFFAAGQRGR